MAGVCKKPQRNGKYRGWYYDAAGKQRFFAGTRRKAETLRIAERLEDDHRQVRLGYRPAPKSADKHRSRPIAEVVAEYLAWGESQGGRGGRPWSKGHARMRRSYLQWWHERLSLRTLADLDSILSRVEKALRELQEAGRAGKTLQSYAETLNALCNWAISRGYLAENSLKDLQGFDTTPQSVRRAMTVEEIHRLLEVAPEHRRLLYELAFTSGLRAKELRSLAVDDLDADLSGLHLHAAWTKDRKGGFQPLPMSLVERLGDFAVREEASRLYARNYSRHDSQLEDVPERPLLFVPTHPAREMAKDLSAAGIPKQNAAGKLDFHSCRVAYVTFVLESGASVKEAQALARHATPQMTMNVYARTRQGRLSKLAEAVGGLIEPKKGDHAASMQRRDASRGKSA